MHVRRNSLVEATRPRNALTADAAFLTPEFVFQPEGSGDLIDLKKIWSILWRNRVLGLAIVGTALVFGILSLFLLSPTYRATASLQIENEPVKVLGTEDVKPITNSQETDRMLQTQIDVLKSRALAETVDANLNLTSSARFLEAMNIEPKSGREREQVIEALRENLNVSLPRNSRVVPINFDSGDPVISAKIANAYAEYLIASNLQRHFDASKYSKRFLSNQLTLTKARLEQSEKSLLNYARSVGLVDPSAGGGDPNSPSNTAPRSLTSANLIDLNQSLASAKAARIQAEGRWREAQSTPAMNLPEVLGNPAMQQMLQRRAEHQSAYQRELQQRKAEHPAVQQAAAAISELNQQISTLAASIRNSIRNQYMISRQQESELASTVSGLKGATLAEQALGIRYNILKREVDTNRQLYDGLLQRYKEVSAEAGVTSNNIAVVDRAVPPLLPISPNPLVNMALALLGGLIVAALVIAARETFHDGVRSPDDFEQRFGVPVLGAVPRLDRQSAAVDELMNPGSNVSEAYQTVRASVELSSEMGTPKTLLITSSREGEGKSTTALAMARNIAQSGKTVLLIDADLRKPSLHKLLAVKLQPGLSNLLTQQMSTESAISETDLPGLSVLPAGPKPPSPADLLSGAAFRSLLTYLRDRYDQIVIDSPPVLGLADAPRLGAMVDGTLMVVEANRSHRGAINAALRRLIAARAHVIGTVLVKFDPAKADLGSAYLLEYYSYGQNSDDQNSLQAA